MTKAKAKPSDGLVGRFVHRHLEAGYLEYFPNHRYANNQGLIKSVFSRDEHGTPNAYEVEWFSALSGYPTNSEVILAEVMLFEKWSFYEDRDVWIQKFEESIELGRINAERQIQKEIDEDKKGR